VSSDTKESGVERLLVDFGLQKDRAIRLALWSLLYMLGLAPTLDVAFADQADIEAAHNFIDLLASGEDD
jgi:hypothetical protein